MHTFTKPLIESLYTGERIGNIYLQWECSHIDTIKYFRITRSTLQNGTEFIGTCTSTLFVDKNVHTSKIKRYTIEAVNYAGDVVATLVKPVSEQ